MKSAFLAQELRSSLAWPADSLAGVFLVGAAVAVLAFLMALAFPRGSAEELASRHRTAEI